MGFRNGVRAIAGPEFCLSLLQMAADSFFAQAKRLCGFLQRQANRCLPQYRLLSWCQARARTNTSCIVTNQSFQANSCRAGGHVQQATRLLCEAIAKNSRRPETHCPSSTHWTKVPVAHAMLECQLEGPPVDPDWIKHS